MIWQKHWRYIVIGMTRDYKMKKTIIDQEDVLYVLKIYANYLAPSAPEDSEIFLAIFEENEDEIKGSILKNGYLLNLKDGYVMGCPKETIKVQLEEGIVEKIDTETYFEGEQP